MTCPVCTSGGAFLMVTGMYSVFFRDKRYLRVWWTLLISLILGWSGYYSVLARSNIARYVLEFLTVGFLIIIFGRLLQLVVRDGHRPIGMTFVENLSRRVKPYTLNPLTIMLKTLIVCMIVFELLGKANFSSAWYIYSTLTLILWIFTLILLHSVGKSYWKNTLQHSFLVSLFLASDSAGGCPLGYGNNKKGEA